MSKKVRYEVYEDGRIYDKVEDKFVKKIKGKSFGSIISNKFKQWFGGSDKKTDEPNEETETKTREINYETNGIDEIGSLIDYTEDVSHETKKEELKKEVKFATKKLVPNKVNHGRGNHIAIYDIRTNECVGVFDNRKDVANWLVKNNGSNYNTAYNGISRVFSDKFSTTHFQGYTFKYTNYVPTDKIELKSETKNKPKKKDNTKTHKITNTSISVYDAHTDKYVDTFETRRDLVNWLVKTKGVNPRSCHSMVCKVLSDKYKESVYCDYNFVMGAKKQTSPKKQVVNKNVNAGKAVSLYSVKDGSFIRTFSSNKDAALYIKNNHKNVTYKAALKGVREASNGKIASFCDYRIKPIKDTILVYNEDNTLVQRFPDVATTANWLQTTKGAGSNIRHSIDSVLRGKAKSCLGYTYKRSSDVDGMKEPA